MCVSVGVGVGVDVGVGEGVAVVWVCTVFLLISVILCLSIGFEKLKETITESGREAGTNNSLSVHVCA